MNVPIVVSRLSGTTDLAAARAWQRALHLSVRLVPAEAEIRLLVDQSGYRPSSLDVHRVVRTVVPDLLALYGVRPALADLVGATYSINQQPDRRLVACALVHDNPFKMATLDRAVGRADQRFFSDLDVALQWLEQAPSPKETPRLPGLLAQLRGGGSS